MIYIVKYKKYCKLMIYIIKIFKEQNTHRRLIFGEERKVSFLGNKEKTNAV